MAMTPENLGSWRDLADQLTPEQRDRLEHIEAGTGDFGLVTPYRPPADADLPAYLLKRARSDARNNLNDALFADVRLPPGARGASMWFDEQPQTNRAIYGVERSLAGRRARITTTAWQFADGVVDNRPGDFQPSGTVYADEGLSSVELRRLAALCIVAADELDAWGEWQPIR